MESSLLVFNQAQQTAELQHCQWAIERAPQAARPEDPSRLIRPLIKSEVKSPCLVAEKSGERWIAVPSRTKR
jgi:hypothetical protein